MVLVKSKEPARIPSDAIRELLVVRFFMQLDKSRCVLANYRHSSLVGLVPDQANVVVFDVTSGLLTYGKQAPGSLAAFKLKHKYRPVTREVIIKNTELFSARLRLPQLGLLLSLSPAPDWAACSSVLCCAPTLIKTVRSWELWFKSANRQKSFFR